jgi:glutathione-regulated potassium-efflux system ancillary protein KefG
MRELLAPIEQTARLCGMEFLPPYAAHGTHGMTPEEMEDHGSDLRTLLEALRDGRITLEGVRDLPRINAAGTEAAKRLPLDPPALEE